MHLLPSWLPIPEAYHLFIENFFKFAEAQATFLNIAAIPVFSFFSLAWLSGRKYNYAENLILNTFITAQQLFFLLLLIPFFEFFPSSKTVMIGIYSIVIIAYNVWAYIQFFGYSVNVSIRSVGVVVIAFVYQFPLNFLIFYLYERFIHHHMHWIPDVYDNIIN
jgi:hypothetical protein